MLDGLGHLLHATSQNYVAVTSGTTNWSLTVPTSDFTSGTSYSVAAKATDSYGNNGTSSTTTFTYNTTTPSVAITYPANNTTYGANWTGAITGTSTANASGSTISTVRVSIQQGSGSCWTGSGNIYTATCPNYVAVTTGTTNWSLTIPTSDFTSGNTYHVTAQATDSYGNTGTSAVVTFTYQAITLVQNAVAGSGAAPETPTLSNPPTNGAVLILGRRRWQRQRRCVHRLGWGRDNVEQGHIYPGDRSPNPGEAEIWYGSSPARRAPAAMRRHGNDEPQHERAARQRVGVVRNRYPATHSTHDRSAVPRPLRAQRLRLAL